MAKKSTLRFLLALGGQRIVVLNQQKQNYLYTESSDIRKNVSPSRLYTAIQSK